MGYQLLLNYYRLSFTGASFFFSESKELTNLFIEHNDWNMAVNTLINFHVNTRSKSTIKRESSELVIRLKTLPEVLLNKLVETDADNAKIILLYSILKSYPIIKMFCLDVLYEKSIMMDYDIQEYEINAFFRKQEELYPEFEKKSDATKYKLRQVIFKILADANLINSTLNKSIVKPYIDTYIAKLILKDSDTSYLYSLLMNEHEINMLGAA